MHNRNHGISEDQLIELLGSLPRVTAPQNLETQLLQRINTDHLQVAQLLSTLSPVSAHPEFDERLFQAIREYKRTGTVIPGPFAGGTSFATLLKGFGWLRTGIAAGAAIILAVGGATVYDSLQPATNEPAVVQPAQSTQPAETHSYMNETRNRNNATPEVTAEGSGTLHTTPMVKDREHALHADAPASTHSSTIIMQPETSLTVSSSKIDTPVEVEAQRGDLNNDTQTVPATTAATMDRKDSIAGQQHHDAPASTVHTGNAVDTGDMVNTGGHIETGNEEDSNPDSVRNKH